MKLNRKRAALFGVAMSAVMVLGAGGFAQAAEQEKFDPLAAVQDRALLAAVSQAPNEQRPAQGDLREVVPSEQTPVAAVAISPISETTAVYDTVADASVISEASYGIVTGTGAENTSASFVVIRDASAPTSYDFAIGDPGTTLAVAEDGSVIVTDAHGQAINYLMAPWARDANNVELATHYTVADNVVTQHVDTTGAVFPVVADPTTGCGTGWCSVYFDHAETKAIAAGGPTGAGALTAGCALLNPVVGAGCAIVGGAIAAVALGADANGNCVGIVGYGFPGTPYGGWNPFIENQGSSHCP
ncbi:MAG TPA: hypothetical protein VNJ54_03005 [Plantibacter sp.]|uniref:hypothetical protein n=1 Tax=Plantibacter sp. TaxID=1871045 RepID=UPI002C099A2D|nr:hypothetical protein [Plantibacter sp.]